MQNINLAVIGIGRWGKCIVNESIKLLNEYNISNLHLITGNNYAYIINKYKKENVFFYKKSELNKMLKNDITHVIISTNFETHYELVITCIESGVKYILVEKPYVKTIEEAQEIDKLIKLYKKEIYVGYEYLYDKGICYIKEYLSNKKINYVKICLLNKKKKKNDINIIENLVSHQLSILQFIFGDYKTNNITFNINNEILNMKFKYGDINVELQTSESFSNHDNLRIIWIGIENNELEYDFDNNTNIVKFKNHETNNITNLCFNELNGNLFNEIYSFVKCEKSIFFDNMNLLVNNLNTYKEYSLWLNTQNLLNLEKEYNFKLEVIKIMLEQKTIVKHLSSFMDKIELTQNLIKERPYIDMNELCLSTKLENQEISSVYNILSISQTAKEDFLKSNNYDYLNAVKFLGNNSLEVTFFIGITCPYRCFFCQSVIENNGIRKLKKYPYTNNNLIKYEEIDVVFIYLVEKRKEGRKVTVKISGGLEPLTDYKRVTYILTKAYENNIPCKLYTNGFLIDKINDNRNLLKFTDIRISLNAINEKEYMNCYGRKKNDFDYLKNSIHKLNKDKTSLNKETMIGLKAIINIDNVNNMVRLLQQAIELKCDYIDISCDFSEGSNKKLTFLVQEQLKEMKRLNLDDKIKVMVGGSLYVENIYSNKPKGICDSSELMNYKIFIDPAGHVFPFHAYAFPNDQDIDQCRSKCIGKIEEYTNFNDLIENGNKNIEISYEELNPFELMLILELKRKRNNMLDGFERTEFPYKNI